MKIFGKRNRIGKSCALALAIGGFVLWIATSLVGSAFSVQATPTNDANVGLQQFVGTWQAKFKGKIFETIVLNNQDGKITGTVSRGEIQLNDNGELTSAEQNGGTDPIIEAKVIGKTLLITCKDEDGDSIQAEIKLTGDRQAELQMVTPPNVSAPKPWKLERESANKSTGDAAKDQSK